MRMGADSTTHQSKCHGYLSWKNKGKNRRKQRDGPKDNAPQRIHTEKRIYPMQRVPSRMRTRARSP